MGPDVRTSVLVGFTDEYAVRSFPGGNPRLGETSAPRLLAAQLVDRRIEIGPGDVRPNLIENGEFPLERGNDGGHAGLARRGWSAVFHDQIPSKRKPCPAGPHMKCAAPAAGPVSR